MVSKSSSAPVEPSGCALSSSLPRSRMTAHSTSPCGMPAPASSSSVPSMTERDSRYLMTPPSPTSQATSGWSGSSSWGAGTVSPCSFVLDGRAVLVALELVEERDRLLVRRGRPGDLVLGSAYAAVASSSRESVPVSVGLGSSVGLAVSVGTGGRRWVVVLVAFLSTGLVVSSRRARAARDRAGDRRSRTGPARPRRRRPDGTAAEPVGGPAPRSRAGSRWNRGSRRRCTCPTGR